MRRVRCLWSWTSVSPMTDSEVALTLVLMDTYIMTTIPGTSGRLHSKFVRLLFLQAHRETDRFFAASGVQLTQSTSDLYHYKSVVFSSHFKSKVDRRTHGLRHVTGPFPVSPVPALAGEVAHRYRFRPVIRSVQTGSPFHRLQPVPVNHFTG